MYLGLLPFLVSVQIELAALLGKDQKRIMEWRNVSVQIELAALLGFTLRPLANKSIVSVQIELAALLGSASFKPAIVKASRA